MAQPAKSPVADPAELTNEYATKLTDLTKKVNAAYVDTYETVALGAADLQEKLAQSSDNEWVQIVGAAQAGLTREVTKVYTSAARELVK